MIQIALLTVLQTFPTDRIETLAACRQGGLVFSRRKDVSLPGRELVFVDSRGSIQATIDIASNEEIAGVQADGKVMLWVPGSTFREADPRGIYSASLPPAAQDLSRKGEWLLENRGSQLLVSLRGRMLGAIDDVDGQDSYAIRPKDGTIGVVRSRGSGASVALFSSGGKRLSQRRLWSKEGTVSQVYPFGCAAFLKPDVLVCVLGLTPKAKTREDAARQEHYTPTWLCTVAVRTGDVEALVPVDRRVGHLATPEHHLLDVLEDGRACLASNDRVLLIDPGRVARTEKWRRPLLVPRHAAQVVVRGHPRFGR